ncbi:MAG: DUF523 domain-containing protein [Clostridia bacterium]|nr:DUF523 domain-containing protein [Clostridia bacterium]
MLVVSACLAGIHCRYDHGTKADETVMRLVREGKAIPVCPEMLGGMTTPRPPSERTADGSAVVNCEGRDVTAEFMRGAEETLHICRMYGVNHAILKARSPSCGKGLIYNGNFDGGLREGNGVTAELLMNNGISVELID